MFGVVKRWHEAGLGVLETGVIRVRTKDQTSPLSLGIFMYAYFIYATFIIIFHALSRNCHVFFF